MQLGWEWSWCQLYIWYGRCVIVFETTRLRPHLSCTSSGWGRVRRNHTCAQCSMCTICVYECSVWSLCRFVYLIDTCVHSYEFFAKRQLVTLFSAPNYCGEFDNAGAMMSVDDTLMCSFQILKPAEKKFQQGGFGGYGAPRGPMGGMVKRWLPLQELWFVCACVLFWYHCNAVLTCLIRWLCNDCGLLG